MESKSHWDRVYTTRPSERLSWYQEHAQQSLRLIHETGVPRSAGIIDVGGGASTLVDDLLADGYSNVTVLDVSAAALNAAKSRLGARAERATWLVADITTAQLLADAYDIWHDRAVFHFLTEQADRQAYVAAVMRAVRPGGHVIVATFAEDGPDKCSGLPVVRYSSDALHSEFGSAFALLHQEREAHHTPTGAEQRFLYCYCRKIAPSP